MRNFVAKNDFNRASTHKSERDYTRLSKHELYELLDEEFSMEEDWGISEDDLKPPKKVVSKSGHTSRNYFNNKGIIMNSLANRLIGVLDIESLGTPGDCKGTNIVMPNFGFVFLDTLENDPFIIYGKLNAQEQINKGATVSARTIAFWMSEALHQSSPAYEMQRILNGMEDAKILVANPRLEEGKEVTTHAFMSNADAFNEVNQITEGIKEIFENPRNLRFYGNGPQFDMSIYETVSCHANEYDLNKAIVPWQFWDVVSARNPRDYFEALGGNWKELEAQGSVWAEKVIERYNLISKGIYPVKHDPVYDALVEAFCIKSVESKLKI